MDIQQYRHLRKLAIDPSTTTGWALGNHNVACHGIIDISIVRGESEGVKWIKFEKQLIELINTFSPELIVYERVSGRHHNGVVSHSKIVAIIQMTATKYGIPYKEYSAKEIKKFATGNGNAKKEQMIAAAQQRFDYKGTDDNEADAICLFHLSNEIF